ncbi:MAG: energy-coupling factor ABC transporter permease [Coriobacteriia bacterium]|nr:energy-coupling factor ABC transporter permease [Coriobacteriia bacterium]
MHIPDGMLSPAVSIVTNIGSFAIVAYAISWVKRFFDQRHVVLMAVLGALIFAFQMLNFPVGPGTSGHFMGSALAGIMLGPWPATILMTAVLAIQAFMLHDGGIVALGANVLNIAIIGPFVGYAVYRAVLRVRSSRTMTYVAGFLAGWAATVMPAIAAALELWLSGRANLTLVISAMGFWHAVIGIAEGVITALFLGYLLAVRPDLIDGSQPAQEKTMRTVLLTLGVIALIIAGLSFFASVRPDGLEFVWETVLGYE